MGYRIFVQNVACWHGNCMMMDATNKCGHVPKGINFTKEFQMSTFTVSTKADKTKDAVQTKLTINWDGCSQELVKAMATQALVVKLQGGWRKNGIPKEVTVKAVEHAPGTRHVQGPVSIDQLVTQMSPEEKKALIAKLSAM
jgi:hypothetical protein